MHVAKEDQETLPSPDAAGPYRANAKPDEVSAARRKRYSSEDVFDILFAIRKLTNGDSFGGNTLKELKLAESCVRTALAELCYDERFYEERARRGR